MDNHEKFAVHTTMAFDFDIPHIPVECKHFRVNVSMNELCEYAAGSASEGVVTFELTESITNGMSVDLALPEVCCVPCIDTVEQFPIDEVIFGQ